MKVLFLDIDGVLNSGNHFNVIVLAKEKGEHHISEGKVPDDLKHNATHLDPDAIQLLNRIVEEANCEIVISSSWRKLFHIGEICTMLNASGFLHSDRIIGKTPVSKTTFLRGGEIRIWLDAFGDGVNNFVIVDDDSDMLPEQFPRFVKTDFEEGLTPERADKIIELFNS